MSCAILVIGPIGSGKTTTCMDLATKLKAANLKVGGILSRRVFQEGELVGYDGLDLSSLQEFPLTRLKSQACGQGWVGFRDLKYVFSKSGFKQANRVLKRSSKEQSSTCIVFVDEFGRLEKAGKGIYLGIISVVDSLRRGGIAVFLCRTGMVEYVERLIKDRVQEVIKCEPRNFMKLWNMVQKCIHRIN